jgi:tRNA(Ile)-lysidine synthase
MKRRPRGIVGYVEETVSRSRVLREGEALLVAVSGGQDSVALLLALAELLEPLGLRLTVGHVDHGLRGAESDEDEQFVRELAGGLGLQALVARPRVKRPSEEAAREARFAALRELAREASTERIALGHTASDRAETVLMNILRGSGLEGLAAMPAVSGDLVRPLLGVTREQTAAYCEAKGVRPRTDSTNRDESILRNRVRHSLLPLLELEYQPQASEALQRLAGIAERELEWTRPLVVEALEALVRARDGGLSLDLRKLCELPPGLGNRVLREAVAEVRGDLRNISDSHLQALQSLVAEGRTGARAELSGLWVERTPGAIVLRAGTRQKAASFEVSLAVPGEARLPDAGLAIAARLAPVAECDPALRGPLCAQLDARVVGAELVLRSPKPGDRWTPLGMRGTKKLQDFLVDKKIPRAEREGMVVVATTQGEIVWLVGHRVSERAKVTARTERVAELVARPLA